MSAVNIFILARNKSTNLRIAVVIEQECSFCMYKTPIRLKRGHGASVRARFTERDCVTGKNNLRSKSDYLKRMGFRHDFLDDKYGLRSKSTFSTHPHSKCFFIFTSDLAVKVRNKGKIALYRVWYLIVRL